MFNAMKIISHDKDNKDHHHFLILSFIGDNSKLKQKYFGLLKIDLAFILQSGPSNKICGIFQKLDLWVLYPC